MRLQPYQKILVANADASRFETYVREGERGSGVIDASPKFSLDLIGSSRLSDIKPFKSGRAPSSKDLGEPPWLEAIADFKFFDRSDEFLGKGIINACRICEYFYRTPKPQIRPGNADLVTNSTVEVNLGRAVL
jgi:hypothetical protein